MAPETHIPTRSCILCKRKGDLKSFLALVKHSSGKVEVDKLQSIDGRHAYVCLAQPCAPKIPMKVWKGFFERALRVKIEDNRWECFVVTLCEEMGLVRK